MLKILLTDWFADTYPAEWTAMQAHFLPEQLITSLDQVTMGDVVLPRYRTVPFGDFLEAEVQARGAQLINTYEQSARVRNLFQWVDCFKGMTAPVFTEADVRELPEGRYFVKGECSSLKNRGPQFAFANSLAEVETLVEYLSNDSWMSRERLVIRPRRDYKRLGTSDGGLPIFHERRVFTYNGNVLLDGFYWESSRQNITEDIPVLTDDYYTTRDTAVKIANTVAPFVVVDLAQFEDGTWEVIELNDGCQSGLPQDSDNTFYKALADAQND
jgi:hypothetical protein